MNACIDFKPTSDAFCIYCLDIVIIDKWSTHLLEIEIGEMTVMEYFA